MTKYIRRNAILFNFLDEVLKKDHLKVKIEINEFNNNLIIDIRHRYKIHQFFTLTISEEKDLAYDLTLVINFENEKQNFNYLETNVFLKKSFENWFKAIG